HDALRAAEVVGHEPGHRRAVLAEHRLGAAGWRDDGDAELGIAARVDPHDADGCRSACGSCCGKSCHRSECERRNAEPGAADPLQPHPAPPYATENAARTSVSSTPKNVGESATLFAASLSRKCGF